MPPRGNRLAVTVKSIDGVQGSFDVYPGEQPMSVSKVEPINWTRPTDKPVLEAHFTVIGDLGMTGQIIMLNQYQWRALADAKLENFFYGAILWGKSPFKVIEDAQMMLKRGK
jgi:hypothetical protein